MKQGKVRFACTNGSGAFRLDHPENISDLAEVVEGREVGEGRSFDDVHKETNGDRQKTPMGQAN